MYPAVDPETVLYGLRSSSGSRRFFGRPGRSPIKPRPRVWTEQGRGFRLFSRLSAHWVVGRPVIMIGRPNHPRPFAQNAIAIRFPTPTFVFLPPKPMAIRV